MKKFYLIFLALLVACGDQETNPFLADSAFCNSDADCMCGGMDTKSNECFLGNKLYASKYVDLGECPDFCHAKIAKCIGNACTPVIVRSEEVQRPAQLECTTAEDCVPNDCCHATGCVPRGNAPKCGMVEMCTLECQPGTLDCGGSCGCVGGKCVGLNYWE